MATKDKKKKKSSRAEAIEDVKPVEVSDSPAEAESAQQEDVEIEDAPDTATEASSKRKQFSQDEEIEVDVTAPEPPSKRARRALKKGKALPAKQDSDDENKGEKGEKKETTRSEHGVWIGNLPFTITTAELRKWLVDNSEESITDEMITRVKLPMSKDKTKPGNKGFAYIDFKDIAPKVAAIALTETDLNGRKLLIKDSRSFEGRPEKPKEPEAVSGDANAANGQKQQQSSEVDPNASRKIFVGNLGFKTTQEDVQRHFEKCGEIEWAKLATFEDTGKCKGYGWVKFAQPDAAAWAVKGFVKIKEAVETEEDFKGPADDDEDDEEDDAEKKPKPEQQRQFKTRKWWVNRLLGRELKIELAEDDQTRYKKRFRKDPNARKPDAPRGRNQRQNDNKADAPGEVKPLKEAEDIQVARLTGAVVKHTGSKMTFD